MTTTISFRLFAPFPALPDWPVVSMSEDPYGSYVSSYTAPSFSVMASQDQQDTDADQIHSLHEQTNTGGNKRKLLELDEDSYLPFSMPLERTFSQALDSHLHNIPTTAVTAAAPVYTHSRVISDTLPLSPFEHYVEDPEEDVIVLPTPPPADFQYPATPRHDLEQSMAEFDQIKQPYTLTRSNSIVNYTTPPTPSFRPTAPSLFRDQVLQSAISISSSSKPPPIDTSRRGGAGAMLPPPARSPKRIKQTPSPLPSPPPSQASPSSKKKLPSVMHVMVGHTYMCTSTGCTFGSADYRKFTDHVRNIHKLYVCPAINADGYGCGRVFHDQGEYQLKHKDSHGIKKVKTPNPS